MWFGRLSASVNGLKTHEIGGAYDYMEHAAARGFWVHALLGVLKKLVALKSLLRQFLD